MNEQNQLIEIPQNQNYQMVDAIQPIPITAMIRRRDSVIEIFHLIMKKDVHYGVIQGCGDKPVLLKPGAEAVCSTFQVAPEYSITKTELPNGHREYEVVCELKNIRTGVSMGQGLGSASTMEKKYRYRTGDVLTTDPITKEYWDAKNKNDYGKMKELSAGRHPKKTADGQWFWALQGDKVENEDPADQYNTVLKIAKKRALQDSVITSTACSDLFTQDVDETIDPDFINPSGNKNENNEIPPSKQSKKEQALKELKEKPQKESPKDLAKKNKNIIDIARGTWMDYFKMPENMAKSKVKKLVKDHFGIELKDYADITIEQAKAVANMLIKEMTIDGESKGDK